MKTSTAPGDPPPLLFPAQEDWAAWLARHHDTSAGVWLRIAKKASGVPSVSYGEAVEAALCYGWIDGQKKSADEDAWLQRFTPRAKKSIWSKINRQKALALVKLGRIKPAGLKEIERARNDGRWAAAYDSPRGATAPDDFQAALDGNARAKAFFGSLDRGNRYAILFRIQTVRRADTRAKRIQQFISMLENHEKIHP